MGRDHIRRNKDSTGKQYKTRRTKIADSVVETTGRQNLQTAPLTADKYQFNRAWEAIPADLVALNLRHVGELNANKFMARQTSNPPRALRELFATEDFKAREIITEYTGRTGLDRRTVKIRSTIPHMNLPIMCPMVALLSSMPEIPLHKLS